MMVRILCTSSHFSNQPYQGFDLPSVPSPFHILLLSPALWRICARWHSECVDILRRLQLFWASTITQGEERRHKEMRRKERKGEEERLHSDSIVYPEMWLIHFLSSLVYFLTLNKAERFSADGRGRWSVSSSQRLLRMMETREGLLSGVQTAAEVWPPFRLHTDTDRLQTQTHQFVMKCHE